MMRWGHRRKRSSTISTDSGGGGGGSSRGSSSSRRASLEGELDQVGKGDQPGVLVYRDGWIMSLSQPETEQV